jgi:hypothetical protein
VPSITILDILSHPRRLNQYKKTNSLSPEEVDATDFEDPEGEVALVNEPLMQRINRTHFNPSCPSHSFARNANSSLPMPAEIGDDDSEPSTFCLSTLPFEASPPWSAQGISVIAQKKFVSDSLPSVLVPARIFDLGWPHVHIFLKWGEETSSFDRTAR